MQEEVRKSQDLKSLIDEAERKLQICDEAAVQQDKNYSQQAEVLKDAKTQIDELKSKIQEMKDSV